MNHSFPGASCFCLPWIFRIFCIVVSINLNLSVLITRPILGYSGSAVRVCEVILLIALRVVLPILHGQTSSFSSSAKR